MFKMFQRGKKVYELVDIHYDKVLECYKETTKFVGMYLADPRDLELEEQGAKVDYLEHSADNLRRDIVREFLDGALLPQTRKEILLLSQMLDNIADKSQDICRMMSLEGVNIPEEIKPKIMEMFTLTGDQLSRLSFALEHLFSDYEQLTQPGGSIAEISADEGAIDIIENALVKNVYSLDISLSEKNHLRRFISLSADISDYIEDIADRLLIIVVLRVV